MVQTQPTLRHATLLQLSLLDDEIKRHFDYPEELALARIADAQGLGGLNTRQLGLKATMLT